MSDAYTEYLSTNSPLFPALSTSIQSYNQVNELIDGNKDRIYSKIFYVLSLIFGIFTAVFAESLNWLMILIFMDLLLILLIFFAKRFYHKRRKFASEQAKIKTHLKSLGIDIKN